MNRYKQTGNNTVDRAFHDIQKQIDDLKKATDIVFGIYNNNVTKCGPGIVDNDFVRIKGKVFEGRSAAEVRSDIGAGTSSVGALNDLSDVTYSSGNLTISSLDKINFHTADSIITVVGDADHGHDLTIAAGSPTTGINHTGGDLHLKAGGSTGNATGGSIKIYGSEPGSSGSTQRNAVEYASFAPTGTLTLKNPDTTESGFLKFYRDTTLIGTVSADTSGVDPGLGDNLQVLASSNLELVAGNVVMVQGGIEYATFSHSSVLSKLSLWDANLGNSYGLQLEVDDDAKSYIKTTGALSGLGSLEILPNGSLTLASGFGSINLDDSIKIKEQADANGDTAGYGQLWVHDDTPNTLWFTDDAGSDYKISPNIFAVTSNALGMRASAVNTWYLSNQSFGTSITAADWATSKFNYALYNSITPVTLKAWRWVGEIASSVDWEFELWDVTIPSNGTAAASTAAKVGSTQSVSATANAIYTMGETGLSYAVAEGHSLFLLIRYTSGSGSKYTYGTVTMEMMN